MRIFSGIQPTGDVHIGNYVGAIKQWVNLSKTQQETLFCVVDMHAITIDNDAKALNNSIYSLIASLLACGIDTNKSILFVQSSVPQHAELSWILSCVARMGWLNRMTQFKDKAGKDKENASVGLFTYPVLMAADIMLYNATHVPVGHDQKQHLEFARDIALRFNRTYKEDFFTVPEPMIIEEGSRIASLRDGTKKMSKSDPSEQSRILLVDSDDVIAQKIQRAKTDSNSLPATVAELENRPEALNLLTIYGAFSDTNLESSVKLWEGKQFSQLKEGLINIITQKLKPIREKTLAYEKDRTFIENHLKVATEKAKSIAEPVVKEAKKLVGFYG